MCVRGSRGRVCREQVIAIERLSRDDIESEVDQPANIVPYRHSQPADVIPVALTA